MYKLLASCWDSKAGERVSPRGTECVFLALHPGQQPAETPPVLGHFHVRRLRREGWLIPGLRARRHPSAREQTNKLQLQRLGT